MLNLRYWCLFMMQSEKAQLISCFVNDYCIPTTLFKTISKLKYMFLILFKKNFASCDLDFSKLPHLKNYRYDPLHFIIVPEYDPRGSGGAHYCNRTGVQSQGVWGDASMPSLCLSVSLSLCLSVSDCQFCFPM